MNSDSHIGASTSVLVVVILVITAFIRGYLQIWLYGTAFLIWIFWNLIPVLRRMWMKQQLRYKNKKLPPLKEYQSPVPIETEGVILRHVNFRITAYLQSAYPEATWDWMEKHPEDIILHGGTARIQLFGTDDFNYANVIFDNKANIACDVMKIVPLDNAAAHPAPSPKPQPQAIDPQIWYELQGRQILDNLIADLHSKGHASLTIKENGEICITQADKLLSVATVKDFPKQNCWRALEKVLEKEGLAASGTEIGFTVSW